MLIMLAFKLVWWTDRWKNEQINEETNEQKDKHCILELSPKCSNPSSSLVRKISKYPPLLLAKNNSPTFHSTFYDCVPMTENLKNGICYEKFLHDGRLLVYIQRMNRHSNWLNGKLPLAVSGPSKAFKENQFSEIWIFPKAYLTQTWSHIYHI